MASPKNNISLLLILLIVTPGITPSFAHTPPSYGAGSGTAPPAGSGTVPPSGSGTTPPVGTGTVPPSGSGTVPPAGSGTVPPSGAGTVPPSGPGTVPPSGSGTVPPSGSGTVPPSGPGTVPPSGSGMTPPVGAGTVPPSGSGTVPPSGSGTVPPSGPGTVPPSGSGMTPPVGAGTVPPSGSGTVPPSGSGTVPPSGSGMTPPVEAGTVPPSGSGAVPPSGSGTVPPSGSGAVPPSGSGTVPPSGSGIVPGQGAPPGYGGFVPSGSFINTLHTAMQEIQKMIPIVSNFNAGLGGLRISSAVRDCLELFDLSSEELSWSTNICNSSAYGQGGGLYRQFDLQTWLSAALSNQGTCKESLTASGSVLGSMLSAGLETVTTYMSQCLSQVSRAAGTTVGISGRKLVQGFPEWTDSKDRKLLQAASKGVTPDAVVAQDGSGKYKTIMEAINAAPDSSEKRFVIYVKKGVYKEYVEVPKKKWNLMLIGDGMGVTIITGNRNVVDGWTTFRSATVAVNGKGFIARDLTVQNTAGAAKHQAVALRSDSDLSVFYRCAFEGYQDTLYAHALRQFYRECKITGTIDFIFGDAAAVFQDCQLLARQALPNQKNIFTAQGRKDPNQNTGFSFQFCKIDADTDLARAPNPTPTYLGRPWKEYSRTIVMQSYIGKVVQPQGWLEWDGNIGLNTLYYAEFNNTGPGAAQAGRVKWPGYHFLTRPHQATNFTVGHFINGNIWLPKTGVAFTSGFRLFRK